jgi:hypothetical protein
MKPDLVAPGANLIGAMTPLADPRYGAPGGLFGRDQRCETSGECYVADDYHAVASGSSLAAPLVAGAIALLFESEPSLTQEQVRALLQAGARPLEGVVFSEQQVGIGALDIDGAFAAQAQAIAPRDRVPGTGSWLAAAAPHARPDPRWPLVFHAELRDDAGRIADGFDARRFSLDVRGATVHEPLLRLAPGLYRFSVVAPSSSGGKSLRVALRFDEREVMAREVAIEVDPHAAAGLVSARGGCGLRPRNSTSGAFAAGLAGLAAWAGGQRRFRRSRHSMNANRSKPS